MTRARRPRGVVGWVKPVEVPGAPLGLGTRRVRKLFTYASLAPSAIIQEKRRSRVVAAPETDPIVALSRPSPRG